MDGLLAILETILVLSLTYVALATAASALSGAVLRAFRLRARGLRRMIEYIYRNNLVPMLERLDADDESQPFGELLEKHRKGGRPDALCQFVVDMTFMPVVSDDSDPRVEQVRKNDWSSLKDTQDNLEIEEFRQRLKESEIGQEIAKVLEQPQEVKTEFDRLTDQFNAKQGSATNWFSRTARVWSVAFGFVIAIGLNVDSVDLFGSYLDDPSLRSELLAEKEQIVAAAKENAVAAEPGVTQSAIKAENDLAAVLEKVKALREVLEGEEFDSLREQVADEEVQELMESTKQAATTAEDALEETATLVRDFRVTAQSLTTQFPIGWDRFPGCEEAGDDKRCALLAAAQGGGDRRFLSGFGALPGEHVKWLLGVILTGFLVGLGAPFWVQVFNNMLRARNLLTDLRSKVT